MLKIIQNNPYRTLGVYANSPKRDIVANIGKALAFLKVNRSVEYPLDLKGLLPTLMRTLDSMKEAEAHLAIAKEQIKYAQFWFLNMTQIDDVAFNHLIGGDVEGAKMLWGKQESLSSLQNMLLCYLIEDKLWLGVQVAEKLYDKFGDEYIIKIDAHNTLRMTGIELLHQFLDILSDEIGFLQLQKFVIGGDAKKYIMSQAIDPLINKISSEVERAKKIDHKDPKARIEAARKLVANTNEAFSQLKSILPATDSQYQMIADKLGLEILQCGIDYFNNSADDDAANVAMWMQKYAQSVVVGNLAIQRCNENVRILQKIIDEMPPKEVKGEAKEIDEILAWYVNKSKTSQNALELLKKARKPLVSIKEKLGKYNKFYLEQSSLLGNAALSYIIEEVNDAQKDDFPSSAHSLIGTLPYMGIEDSLWLEQERRKQKAIKLKSVLHDAWQTIVYIDLLDKTVDFHSRYKQNRQTLYSIISGLKGFDWPDEKYIFKGCAHGIEVDKFFFMSDSECFSNCSSKSDYKNYIQFFPDGKHVDDANRRFSELDKHDKIFNYGAYLVLVVIIVAIIIIETNRNSSSGLNEDTIYADSVDTTEVDDFDYYSDVDTIPVDTVALENNEDFDDNESNSSNTINEDDYSKYINNRHVNGARPYISIYGGAYSFSAHDKYSTIKVNAPDNCDVVVIVKKNNKFGKVADHIYIRSGHSSSINLPNGTYQPFFYFGKGWNPDKSMPNGMKGGFVSMESFSKDSPQNLQNNILTYTLTLQTNGNFQAQSSNSNEAF